MNIEKVSYFEIASEERIKTNNTLNIMSTKPEPIKINIYPTPIRVKINGEWQRVADLTEEEQERIKAEYYQPRLEGQVILDNPSVLENLEVRGRGESIEKAEEAAGIKYLRELIWIDGAENTSGVIILPYDDYERVYVLEGDYNNPIVRDVKEGQEGDPRPYYRKIDGKTYIFVEHFSGGAGTQLDPYLIQTAEDLNNVRNNLSAHYLQVADIDLSGYANWVPIGDYDNHFRGSLDGNGFRIRNLKINRADNYIGLFGYATGAKFTNIALENIDITGGGVTGGLVGENGWSSTITNCYTTGTVSGENGTGGLVGYNDGNITNCYSTGTVSGVYETGGLVGSNRLVGSNIGNITNSYSTATVSGIYFTGGLVGFNNAFATITNCYTTGTVSGEDYTGGLVGVNYGTIRNCYALNEYVERTEGVSTTFGRVCGRNRGTLENNYARDDMQFITND